MDRKHVARVSNHKLSEQLQPSVTTLMDQIQTFIHLSTPSPQLSSTKKFSSHEYVDDSWVLRLYSAGKTWEKERGKVKSETLCRHVHEDSWSICCALVYPWYNNGSHTLSSHHWSCNTYQHISTRENTWEHVYPVMQSLTRVLLHDTCSHVLILTLLWYCSTKILFTCRTRCLFKPPQCLTFNFKTRFPLLNAFMCKNCGRREPPL